MPMALAFGLAHPFDPCFITYSRAYTVMESHPCPFAALDWLEHAVFALSATDDVIYSNPAAEQLLGVSRRHLETRHLSVLFQTGFSSLTKTIRQARERNTTCHEFDLLLIP
jgi:nitrogen-specific signal transduction histidine kinase